MGYDICCTIIFKLFHEDSYQIQRIHSLPWSRQHCLCYQTSVSGLHNLLAAKFQPVKISLIQLIVIPRL